MNPLLIWNTTLINAPFVAYNIFKFTVWALLSHSVPHGTHRIGSFLSWGKCTAFILGTKFNKSSMTATQSSLSSVQLLMSYYNLMANLTRKSQGSLGLEGTCCWPDSARSRLISWPLSAVSVHMFRPLRNHYWHITAAGTDKAQNERQRHIQSSDNEIMNSCTCHEVHLLAISYGPN